MTNEERLEEIVDQTTKEILEKVEESVRAQVSDLVHAMAAATLELFSQCKVCAEKKEEEPKKKAEEPVKFEINTHGIKLSDEDKLVFSKMVCEFLKGLENSEEEEEEEEDFDEPDLPFDVVGEQVTIKIDDDGKAVIKRKKISSIEEDSEED